MSTTNTTAPRTALASAVETGDDLEQVAVEAPAPKAKRPKVPGAAERKKAAARREAKKTAPKEANPVKEAVSKLRGEMLAMLPAEPTELPEGVGYSRDIRVIAAAKKARTCATCGGSIAPGQPMFQWTSNRPGNDAGYMFHGLSCCGAPTASTFEVDARRSSAARSKGLTLADLSAQLEPYRDLGGNAASLGSVKVGAGAVEVMTRAAEALGVDLPTFRRMAYGHLAATVLSAG